MNLPIRHDLEKTVAQKEIKGLKREKFKVDMIAIKF